MAARLVALYRLSFMAEPITGLEQQLHSTRMLINKHIAVLQAGPHGFGQAGCLYATGPEEQESSQQDNGRKVASRGDLRRADSSQVLYPGRRASWQGASMPRLDTRLRVEMLRGPPARAMGCCSLADRAQVFQQRLNVLFTARALTQRLQARLQAARLLQPCRHDEAPVISFSFRKRLLLLRFADNRQLATIKRGAVLTSSA